MRLHFLSGLLALFVATPVLADFSGQGEFGLVLARGNSETETGNASFDLIWKRGRWGNETNLGAVYARDDGETSANRFVVSNKTDFDLSEVDYLYGALRYDRDEFSSFRFQASLAAGYGRYLLDGERHRLKVEGGPGFRISKPRAEDDDDENAILRGLIDYRWLITDNTRLTNRFLIEAGSDNTFMESAFGLTVAMNDRVSLKTGVSVRHNTDVDAESKNTDILTTVNLVYNFGEE